ncbi:hypothetical protein L9F63_018450, partial [Diploptera punctata]
YQVNFRKVRLLDDDENPNCQQIFADLSGYSSLTTDANLQYGNGMSAHYMSYKTTY